MKILSIGDIHGRDSWKFLLFESPYDYEIWRTAVDAGADPKDFHFWRDLPYTQYDKIIFVGDYVDSFDISNIRIKANLLDIIHFKKALGDKVILLLGNHDIQYMLPNQICSGYRPEMRFDLEQIFRENEELFTFSHQEISSAGEKWLWTHAGVTSKWWENSLMQELKKPEHPRKRKLISLWFDENLSVSEILNQAWKMKADSLFDVDNFSGGSSEWGGPLWVRPYKLNYHPLDGWNQVIGHTPQSNVTIVDEYPYKEKFEGFKHYFIDCLEYGEIEGLITEIL